MPALQGLERGHAGSAYNLGAGHSVKDVVGAIEAVAAGTAPHSIGPRRAGDPSRLVADVGLFKRTFGWQPQYSDMETIIRTAWQWSSKGPAS